MNAAAPPRLPRIGSALRPYLTFTQQDNCFALPLTSVREVLPGSGQAISAVPNTLPFIRGLINLRGQLVAVGDFGQILNGSRTVLHQPASRILVLDMPDPAQQGSTLFGLVVEAVTGVNTLDPARIVSAVEVSSELAPFLSGLYNLQGSLVMVLDAEAIGHCDRW